MNPNEVWGRKAEMRNIHPSEKVWRRRRLQPFQPPIHNSSSWQGRGCSCPAAPPGTRQSRRRAPPPSGTSGRCLRPPPPPRGQRVALIGSSNIPMGNIFGPSGIPLCAPALDGQPFWVKKKTGKHRPLQISLHSSQKPLSSPSIFEVIFVTAVTLDWRGVSP